MISPTQPTSCDRDGFVPGIPVVSGAGLDDRHELIAGEGILGHLTVSRLEDMEGEDDMGEQHEIRQGEEPAQSGEIVEF